MKHLIRNISLALLPMLAACTETDAPIPQLSAEKYIVFGTPEINLNATLGDFAISSGTRATLSNGVEQFTVWGYCVPNDLSGTAKQSEASKDWNYKSKFFTGTADGGADIKNLAKRAVDTSSSWNYNGGQLTEWNADPSAQHSFIAAAGNATFSMEKASSLTTNGHGPRLTITLPRTAGTAVGTALDRTEQPDVLIAAKFDHKQRDGHVNLSFFHIMTGLRFKFHNHSNKDLIIKSMTFRGTFHRQAVIDFTTDDPEVKVPTDAAANRYSGTFTIIQNNPSSWQTITHGSEDFAGGDNPAILLLLPNPDGTTDRDGKYVLGSNKSIDIIYRFADDPAERPDRSFTTPDDFVLNYLPQPNTLHTAHFNFIGDNFVLTFQADDKENWANGSDNNFTIH